MSEQDLLRDVVLPNGLQVTVHDGSRHYFGGYWQVAIEVTCPIAVSTTLSAESAEAAEVRVVLGETVLFVRRLERMAVRNDERETVLQHLLERFERTLLPFLGNECFPARFVQDEYRKHLKRTVRGIPCLS